MEKIISLPIPYDNLQKYTDYPLGELISPKEYGEVLADADAAKYIRFMEGVIAGGNRYVLEGGGFFFPPAEDTLKANFLQEVSAFLPKLQEQRKLAHMFNQALFSH
jgi:hypothetical protein